MNILSLLITKNPIVWASKWYFAKRIREWQCAKFINCPVEQEQRYNLNYVAGARWVVDGIIRAQRVLIQSVLLQEWARHLLVCPGVRCFGGKIFVFVLLSTNKHKRSTNKTRIVSLSDYFCLFLLLLERRTDWIVCESGTIHHTHTQTQTLARYVYIGLAIQRASDQFGQLAIPFGAHFSSWCSFQLWTDRQLNHVARKTTYEDIQSNPIQLA